jgi:tRNA nucleotidyltransferase (CCA-adding enzyme)
VDSGVHTEMVCDMAARLAPGDALIGFAALTHDLGKALTPLDELPKHHRHEVRGLDPLERLCDRLKVPAAHRELARCGCREHLSVHRIAELRPGSVHDLIARCDGFRKPARIAELALVCEADKRGRGGMQEAAYPQAEQLRRMHAAAMAVRAADLVAKGLEGPALGEALRKARIDAIAAASRL